jgi:hypothetical protein
MSDDFFGEWVAPGILMTGAGVTAYRTYKEARAKGSISAPWREQRKASELFDKIQASRAQRNFKTAAEIEDMFSWYGPRGPSHDTFIEELKATRNRAIHGLVKRFDLSEKALELGADFSKGDFSGVPIRDLIGATKENPHGIRAYREHLERVASSYGLDRIAGATTSAGRRRAINQFLEIGSNFEEGSRAVGELVKAHPEMTAANRVKSVGYRAGFGNFKSAFAGAGRDDLVGRVQALYAQINQLNRTPGGAKMQIKFDILSEAGQDFFAGVTITSNKAVLRLPFEQEGRIIRFGSNYTSRGVAKFVPAKDIAEQLKRASEITDVHALARRADTFFIDQMLDGGLEDFRKGALDHNTFLQNFVAQSREDQGRVIMRTGVNSSLTDRYAHMMALDADPSINLSPAQKMKIQEVFERNLHDPSASLSANQISKQNVMMPTQSGHVYGASPIGLTGDNKSIAQTLRDRVFIENGTRGSTAVPALAGSLQVDAGDLPARLATYSMPEDLSTAIFNLTGRADLHLHEDEFALAKQLQYEEAKRIGQIAEDSPLHTGLNRLFERTDKETITALAEGRGLEYAATLRERMAANSDEIDSLGDDIGRQTDDAAKDTLRDMQRTRILENQKYMEILDGMEFRPGDVLGFAADGTPIRVPTNAEGFRLTEAINLGTEDSPRLAIAGRMDRPLRQGDKLMRDKGIIKADFSRTGQDYIRKVGTIAEVLRQSQLAGEQIGLEVRGLKGQALQDKIQHFVGMVEERVRTNAVSDMPLPFEDLMQGTVLESRWRSAAKVTEDIALYTTQGTKKIADANMAEAAHGLMEHLNAEREQLSQMLPTISDPKRQALLESRIADIDSLGFIRSGGTTLIDQGRGFNVATRFRNAVALSMEAMAGRKKWSAEVFFKDLAASNEFARTPAAFQARVASLAKGNDAAMALYKDMHAEGLFSASDSIGEAWASSLQRQLQWGEWNRTVAPHGSPVLTGGSGRQGSFSTQTMTHLQRQGGAMADLGVELAGRLTDDTMEEARAVFRRNAVLDAGDAGNAIDIRSIGSNPDIGSGTIESLFSGNQFRRDAAFEAIGKAYGQDASSGLTFAMGDDAQVYHPREISRHTGGFRTDSGVEIPSGIDKALRDGMMKAREGQISFEEEAGRYREELSKITVGREQAPNKAYSGHVQGSRRLQARSTANDEMFRSFLAENYRDKLGIREKDLRDMASELGLTGPEKLSRLNELRRGEMPSVVHRSPDTELHRITSVQTFSIDQALEDYGRSMAKGRSAEEILGILAQKDEARHQRLKERLERNRIQAHRMMKKTKGGTKARGARVKAIKVDSAKKRAQIAEQELIKYYKQQHQGTAVWLPKQLEQPLGADFDDDHVSVFIAKDKTVHNALQERASYQESLIGAWDKTGLRPGGGREVDFLDRTRPASITPEMQAAEEDFLYKTRQRELYANLKAKDPSVLTAEGATPGTEKWELRTRAAKTMGLLEKAEIGSMTNATDMARRMYRLSGGAGAAAGADARIFAEMLMGVMPESILKIRQVAMENVESVRQNAEVLKELLRGQHGASDKAVDLFRTNFRELHQVAPGGIIDEIASPSYVKSILEAATAAKDKGGDYDLLAALKQMDATEAARKEAMNAANNALAPTLQHELYRDAVKDVIPQMTPGQRRIKNAAIGMSDVYDIMLKHKKPLLLGAGVALATSMLLGSPGSISSEEANAAGARHATGSPSVPPTDMGHAARLSTQTGRAVRVRGNVEGDFDPSVIAAKLGESFPGAGLDFTVNDYRDRINEEYIRKRLDR